MSLHCPKCGGLVYARSNAKCGFCGAALPAEFAFTAAELAAEAERNNAPVPLRKPYFPLIFILCWLTGVLGWGYLAVVEHSWVKCLLAGMWALVLIERWRRYWRDKRRYDWQEAVGDKAKGNQ